MSLDKYREKRNFDQTPEPGSGGTKPGKGFIFVVQKHQASHLHYDFRLEIDGILKSWAVPKGPSMNPSDKRLAVMVEDHPLEYAGFEGQIPESNYGAGTVKIWDSGTWLPDRDFREPEKALEEGTLEFTLSGKHLKGGFTLVRMKKSTTKDGWLLIKQHDDHSTAEKYDANRIKP